MNTLPTAAADIALHTTHDAEERDGLTAALTRVALDWGLTNDEAAALAGVAPRTWSRIKDGTFRGTLGQDQMMRASLLIGIYTGLRALIDGPLTHNWPKTVNAGFEDHTPVAMMIEGGIPAMLMIRNHIDALQGDA
ncbi:antitoxin Xre-like helix-turn-helix domain-containing protein [Oricola sp.]|uniref:antitoxin Xre-like helix-turn-helix domain-containing protein n=1 Tax=Oricola sp. TaxID=1979950 RepID=UPI003BABF009